MALFTPLLLAALCAAALVAQGLLHWSRGGAWGRAEWALWGGATLCVVPLSRLASGAGRRLVQHAPISTLSVCAASLALVVGLWMQLAGR